MGQKQATFNCSQWNDAQSKWVSTFFAVRGNGQLVSCNRKTKHFIAGVQLSNAYPLLVFGPLCNKFKWTPQLPAGRVDANLLGIPTGTDAFQDSHKICWFYFEEPKVLISLLEAILIVLDKMKVQLPGGEDGRSKRKRRYASESDTKDAAALGMVIASSNGYIDLSPWYIDGLAGGWTIGSVPISDPRCFCNDTTASESAMAFAAMDAGTLAVLASSADWGSNCGAEWDTSGACAALTADGVFCNVNSFDFHDASHAAWGASDAGGFADHGHAACAAHAACGAHASCAGHACGGGAGCGGGGCGGGM